MTFSHSMKTFTLFSLPSCFPHTLLRLIRLKTPHWWCHCSAAQNSLWVSAAYGMKLPPSPLWPNPFALMLNCFLNHEQTFVLVSFNSNIRILYNNICSEALKLSLHFLTSEYFKVPFLSLQKISHPYPLIFSVSLRLSSNATSSIKPG